jgi:hypothetical protein
MTTKTKRKGKTGPNMAEERKNTTQGLFYDFHEVTNGNRIMKVSSR